VKLPFTYSTFFPFLVVSLLVFTASPLSVTVLLTNGMIKKFLLHKYKEKSTPPHGQAHLVFADTRANAEKPKELALSHCTQTE